MYNCLMKKIKVAVLFGGLSPEHEVSIITGVQVMNALDGSRYDVLPVYVTKDGRWILGDKSFLKVDTFKNIDRISNKKSFFFSPDPTLKGLIPESIGFPFIKTLQVKMVDIVFLAFHGRYGEDGAVQGLLELSGIPYTGCDVETSAIGMDKVVSKIVARGVGIPVLDDIWLNKQDWMSGKNQILSKICAELKFPVFVKPARLGSSIAITKAHNRKELIDGLDVAFFYDSKVLIERSLEDAKEINISVLGNNDYQTSVCEMPKSSGEVLTFGDKYISEKSRSKGMVSAKRVVPAQIKIATRNKIEEYSKRFFAAVGGQGISRVDFLVSRDETKIYFNEINTLPGSVAFYLWEKTNLTFNKLLDRLIQLGFERDVEKKKLITTFSSNILAGFGGTKNAKI